MQISKLNKFWIVIWVIAVGFFIGSEIIIVSNIMEIVEPYLSSYGVSSFSPIFQDISVLSFSLFEFSSIFGLSLLSTSIPWHFLSRFQDKINSTHGIIRSLIEVFKEYLCLSILEIFVLIFDVTFILIFGNHVFLWDSINISYGNTFFGVIRVAWMNLMLITLFQTFIAFQAYRAKDPIEKIVDKIVIDYLEGFTVSIVLLLVFLPFYGFSLSIDFGFIALLLYWLFIGVVTINILINFEKKIELYRESSEHDYTLSIFFISLQGVFVPFAILISGLPTPLYFMITLGFGGFILLHGIFLIFSFVITSIYYILGSLGFNTFVSGKFDPVIDHFKYEIALVMANRGTIFEYPTPVNPYEDIGFGEPIPYHEGAITLKIACGQCYHVFKVKTAVKSDETKSFPCPFCGSNATTPVWEK